MIITGFHEARNMGLMGMHSYDAGNRYIDCWFENGKLHRTNGPAWANYYWFIDGNDITDEVKEWRKSHNFKRLPLIKEQEVLFKLRFL